MNSERIGSDGDRNLTYKAQIKLQEQKDLLPHLGEELKSSEDFQNFVLNLYQLFDHVDAGGVSLSDIFTLFTADRIDIFEQFLVNL